MSDETGGPPLEEDLGWMLGTLLRAYHKAVEPLIGDIPSGPRGYLLLAAAAGGEGLNQAALAERLGMDRTVLTYLIDDLEALDLVKRRPDPADRRSRLIGVTDTGRRVLADHRRKLDLVSRQVLGSLSQEEATFFLALLRRVALGYAVNGGADDLCRLAAELAGPS